MNSKFKTELERRMKELNKTEVKLVKNIENFLVQGVFYIPYQNNMILFQGYFIDYKTIEERLKIKDSERVGYLAQLACYYHGGTIDEYEFAIVGSFSHYEILVGKMWQQHIDYHTNNEYIHDDFNDYEEGVL